MIAAERHARVKVLLAHRTGSGSLAMLAAMRRASSRVRCPMVLRRIGFYS
jgi:hypothetical protein